jgi:hypothetical protein|tara:strand:- start:8900 stop:9115 length:216 start_codon:yes stop_codon:yes gene_type:complete
MPWKNGQYVCYSDDWYDDPTELDRAANDEHHTTQVLNDKFDKDIRNVDILSGYATIVLVLAGLVAFFFKVW